MNPKNNILSRKNLIPKIIHYCWFGPKTFSRTVRKCIATWHKHLSDYEFCFWNEDSCAAYAVAHNLSNPMDHPFVKGAYAAKKYAFVADYVRFWALYHCGGVYLDTDMYVLKDIDDLLWVDFFAAWETQQRDVVSCGIIGSVNRGMCVQDILAKYDELEFDETQLSKYVVPRLVTPIALQYVEAKIYPYDYFYPLPYNERFVWRKMKYNTANTYAVHLWDISWGKWQAKMKDQMIFVMKKILRKYRK